MGIYAGFKFKWNNKMCSYYYIRAGTTIKKLPLFIFLVLIMNGALKYYSLRDTQPLNWISIGTLMY